jgi:hypothetical protein
MCTNVSNYFIVMVLLQPWIIWECFGWFHVLLIINTNVLVITSYSLYDGIVLVLFQPCIIWDCFSYVMGLLYHGIASAVHERFSNYFIVLWYCFGSMSCFSFGSCARNHKLALFRDHVFVFVL